MAPKQYTKLNFHKHTFCVFNEVSVSEIESLKPDYVSKSGSAYYFCDGGVFRYSNHWSRVANCKWRLEKNSAVENSNRLKLGFASWSSFQSDNDVEKLYYVEVDFENQKAHFQHKNNCKDHKILFRTASEVSNQIKQIRHLLQTELWAKHFGQELDYLRKTIIQQMVLTNLSLQEIKRALL